jgi:hypothetical protein
VLLSLLLLLSPSSSLLSLPLCGEASKGDASDESSFEEGRNKDVKPYGLGGGPVEVKVEVEIDVPAPIPSST